MTTKKSMLNGMFIVEVEPGTEIDIDGKKLTVNEKQAVTKGKALYMTETQARALLRGDPGWERAMIQRFFA